MNTLASPPALSQSKRNLMACDYLYRDRVVNGHKDAGNEFALRGTQIHSALADYTAHLVSTRQNSDPKWFDDEVLRRSYLPDALEMLAELRDRFSIDPENVVEAELHLQAGEEVEGTLDLLLFVSEDSAIVIDYKSFFQVVAADSFQCSLYPFLVFVNYPNIERVKFVLDFIRYGVQRSVEFTRADDFERIAKWVCSERQRQVRLHSEAGEFVATPGPQCSWCGLLTSGCPIADTNPYAQQSPEERVRFHLWATAALKQNTAILKDFAAAQGAITVADANLVEYEAAFALTASSEYPLNDALPVIRHWEAATGEDLGAKLTVGGLSALAKAKKRNALADQLVQIRDVKMATRFHVKKVKGGDDDE